MNKRLLECSFHPIQGASPSRQDESDENKKKILTGSKEKIYEQ